MFRTEFPDLKWLRAEIAGRAVHKYGWPNVIINTKVAEAHRPDITGPLSLFMNISGTSLCGVDKHMVRVEEDMFFLSNRGENYSLDIENPNITETFNIHFGEQMMEDVFRNLQASDTDLLDDPCGVSSPVHFFTKLYPKDEKFKSLVNRLYANREILNSNMLLHDELLTDLLLHLLYVHKDIGRQIEKLPPVKRSTGIEAYRRLSLSLDHIHSYYDRNITLEELAALSCLSKFHYLRLFKVAFGTTPYHYLVSLRLQKARHLLHSGSMPITDISVRSGFENISSFSRAFYRHFGQWPQQFRDSRKKLAILVNDGSAGLA